MIKAIVFDLGGVLFSEGKAVALAHLAEERGYDRGIVNRFLSSDQAMELRRGRCSDEWFWGWVQEQLPPGYSAAAVKEAWYDGYVIDEAIYALIQRLRGKYKIIAFSGNIRSRVDYLEEKYRFRHLFDLEIYSFDYGFTKPDERFVEILLEKAACRPEEIAYIEDNDRYAEPAKALGVQVVIYARGEAPALEAKLKAMGVEF